LADMGIAWLTGEMCGQELADGRLVSYASELGQIELDIVLYYRNEGMARQVGEVVAAMERLS